MALHFRRTLTRSRTFFGEEKHRRDWQNVIRAQLRISEANADARQITNGDAIKIHFERDKFAAMVWSRFTTDGPVSITSYLEMWF